MEIASDFAIAASPDEAYRLLLDLEQVVPCIPGGELGAPQIDGSYPARVTLRLGPMRLLYEGTVRIAEQDDEARRAVLSAKAREARGQGSAQAEMTMQVSGDGFGARVEILTELQLTGRAAQMGRGVVEDVARRFVGEMAACLQSRLATEGAENEAASAPLRGLSLLGAVLGDRIMKLLARLKGDRHAGA